MVKLFPSIGYKLFSETITRSILKTANQVAIYFYKFC